MTTDVYSTCHAPLFGDLRCTVYMSLDSMSYIQYALSSHRTFLFPAVFILQLCTSMIVCMMLMLCVTFNLLRTSTFITLVIQLTFLYPVFYTCLRRLSVS
jgi:hypothetical protein